MRVERQSGADERRILIGMVTDPGVLGRIATRWAGEGPFASPWANMVGGWCVKFYAKYNAPPGNYIETIYEKWSGRADRDKDTAALVNKFLATLSGEYADQPAANSAVIIDLAGNHFNRVRMTRLKDEIEQHLEDNEVEEAYTKLEGWGRVELGTGAGVDMMQDAAAFQAAFESKAEPLIKWRGALGEFFGDSLERDGFICYMASEKRGKTWWLLETAWQAMWQRRRVAFFEVGDMSEVQVLRRWGARAARHPLKARGCLWPKAIEHTPGQPFAVVTHEERVFDTGLTWQGSMAALNRVIEERVKTRETLIRLSCHPSGTQSVAGIRDICRAWERDGWVPDVIVIDYADLLAPPPGYRDKRDQIDATWQKLRGLSQEMHCLVITATQANALSYNAQTIGRSHFSEDKRKLAHTTGIVGINTTHDEMIMGLRRLNWVVRREDEYIESKCVHVAGCLALGNPAIRSIW